MIAELRPMTKADTARVAELERICFRTPWTENMLKSELRNSVAHYYVLDSGTEVVGYAGMWIVIDEAHITNVAVDPEYRKQGLGRRIMLGMMEKAYLFGAFSMTLEVRETNLIAQHLYYSMDFVKEGRRRGYYSDTGEDALILWNKDIKATADRIKGGNRS